MLTTQRIERDFTRRRWDSLLDRILANGLPLPPALRMRLSQSAPAVAALALRRVTELTYGPTPPARAMGAFLADSVGADGTVDGDPLATAAVVAALTALSGTDENALPELPVVLDRLWAGLAGMQGEDGLFDGPDRNRDQRALTAAFIAFLLGDLPPACQSIRLFDLAAWFDQHRATLCDDVRAAWMLARGGLRMSEPALAA